MDGRLPLAVGEPGIHLGSGVAVDHVAGADDDRSEPIGMKRAPHVGGAAALPTEAWHEDPRVRHCSAESVELSRPRRTDNGPNSAIGSVADCRTAGGAYGQLFDTGGHMFVDGTTV